MVTPWQADEDCLRLNTAGSHFEVEFDGLGTQAAKGCLGINASGHFAVAVQRTEADLGSYLQLDSGTVTSSAPSGYLWAKSWRLELVLHDGRTRVSLGTYP